MMDHSRWRMADRQAGTQIVFYRSANYTASMRVKNACGERDLLPQSNGCDVGYPQLVDRSCLQSARQISMRLPLVLRVSGSGHESSFPHAQQIVLAHQSQDALVADWDAMPRPPCPD